MANDQGAYSNWAVKLVRRQAQRGHAERMEVERRLVERHFADHLHRVRMQQHSGPCALFGRLMDRLYYARFVIAEHQAQQAGGLAQQFAQMIEIGHARRGDAEALEPEALLREAFGRADDRGVFDRRDR